MSRKDDHCDREDSSREQRQSYEDPISVLSIRFGGLVHVWDTGNVLDLRGVGWGIHLLEEGKLVLLRVLLINQIQVFAA